MWRSWSGTALPVDDGSSPEVHFVDSMLRRRLGRLSRMALHVAHEAAREGSPIATIFSSRHGELARTVNILHAVSANEMPSPAAFSLSVHNSAAGIFSISRADQVPSTALAAGDETLLWALQEALIRLEVDPDAQVLVVYADEPLPTEYRASASAPEPAHALAFLLSHGEGLRLEWSENCEDPPSPEPFSLHVLAHLLGKRASISWHGERLSVSGHGRV
jgi:hypothetical protein